MQHSKKKLVLHIGTHKTGTSYIQRLLLVNQNHLAKHSIALAQHAHPVLGHHHHLVNLITEAEPDYNEFLEALRPEQATIIFSSECMLSWLMNHEEAEALCARLIDEWELRVAIYLRRQDFMKESVFAEVATDWYQGDIYNEHHYCYDYTAYVQRLENLFGSKRLRVGIYRDDRPQDLAQDFFRLVGLGYAAKDLKKISPARVSPSRTVTALLAKCSKENTEMRDRVREILESVGAGTRDPYKYQMSPAERRAFLTPFLESNRLIARSYCPDAEDYLTTVAAENEDWQPIPPLSVDEVSDILSQLLELLEKNTSDVQPIEHNQ